MASRRKSTVPCMIRLSEVTEQDDKEMDISSNKAVENRPPPVMSKDTVLAKDARSGYEEAAPKHHAEDGHQPRKQQGGYECKYCPFSTQNLTTFKEHVDSSHPNVILNPLYLCAVCNFNTKKFDSLTEHNETCHPGECNFKFKRIKVNSQTILEQTIEGVTNVGAGDASQGGEGSAPFIGKSSTTKTGQPKLNKKLESPLDNLNPKDQITINVNGMVIIPESTIKEGLSHVMPLLQRPPNYNSIPKIAVPLNTTKYNPSLDNNMTLITSFNKFPYPTHAEMSWLTAASKHPEEQIKVWFTTQRLKQGITWSPEEVEEARKKMFDGSIPPVQQTFAVVPTPLTKPAKLAQSVVQTVPCQLLGQSGVVLTTVASGSTMTCSPIALTVANQSHTFKRPLTPPALAPEVKRPMVAPVIAPEKKRLTAPVPASDAKLAVAATAIAGEATRPIVAPAQASEVKQPGVASIPMSEVKKSVIAPVLTSEAKHPAGVPVRTSEAKHPIVAPVLTPEAKRKISAPVLAPEGKRPTAAVIVALEAKRPVATLSAPVDANPLVATQVGAPEGKLNATANAGLPDVKRPTIIQSVQSPRKTASPKNAEDHIAEFRATYDTCQGPEDEAAVFSGGELRKACPNNKAKVCASSESVSKETPPRTVLSQFPLLDRVKGKTAEQLKILEESFQRSSFPTHSEVESLMSETRLSKMEIDCWFSERRALRDNLEQAVLNSMGSRKADGGERQRPRASALNGMHEKDGRPKGSPLPAASTSPSSAPIDGKSLLLLRDVFAQTRWPSPEEYSQLEVQTGLARTEIVRWFKDNRLRLKSGALEWMELFQQISGRGQNGQGGLSGADRAQSALLRRCQENRPARPGDAGGLPECARLSSRDIADWFTNKLGRNGPNAARNGAQNGITAEDPGSWVDVTMGAGASLRDPELVLDTGNVVKTPLEG
ncbi:zinc fingers and homeoboxes protein 2-like [Scleropages formosus]|uniref:Zinc fingers and homeoboxes protein 2-like n=1 Tax=Scleropages formosus TaxID=113540 RepID=A0A0P7U953_SCLFO|nr:zinc fingers and homeoboxes protein 2-like [Scleropages formosus]